MTNALSPEIKKYLKQFQLPEPSSHKGQNGKLLIIGGSDLFHAASRWSLDVASKFVDMVFYSSIPSNNALIHEAKGQFWNGIVVDRDDLESYLEEADCVLIGPGMTRVPETEKLVNALLKKYPSKKWVIDAGALQMVDVQLLNKNCIVTPHKQEFLKLIERVEEMLIDQKAVTDVTQPARLELRLGWSSWTLNFDKLLHKTNWFWFEENRQKDLEEYLKICEKDPEKAEKLYTALKGDYLLTSLAIQGATIVRKGEVDVVAQQDPSLFDADHQQNFGLIEGGNGGMTKGGTGDVLAGLIAALYCTHDAMTAAVLGSYFNKKAGDDLYMDVGPNFNSSDLVNQIPKTIWVELQIQK